MYHHLDKVTNIMLVNRDIKNHCFTLFLQLQLKTSSLSRWSNVWWSTFCSAVVSQYFLICTGTLFSTNWPGGVFGKDQLWALTLRHCCSKAITVWCWGQLFKAGFKLKTLSLFSTLSGELKCFIQTPYHRSVIKCSCRAFSDDQ